MDKKGTKGKKKSRGGKKKNRNFEMFNFDCIEGTLYILRVCTNVFNSIKEIKRNLINRSERKYV